MYAYTYLETKRKKPAYTIISVHDNHGYLRCYGGCSNALYFEDHVCISGLEYFSGTYPLWNQHVASYVPRTNQESLAAAFSVCVLAEFFSECAVYFNRLVSP